jgi:xylitol oxidase
MDTEMTDLRNWAGNIAYSTNSILAPRSVPELQDLVRRSSRLRALGSRHSFNRIADTDGDLISMRGLDKVIALDPAAHTVTVEGGITYGQLCPWLDAQGFALHNLASLPHISVVGAVTTATHGSGNSNGNLATAVAALEIVTATGDIVSLKRGDADFNGAIVGLGALGVVSSITLDIQPTFAVRQDVFVDLPFAALVDNFEAIGASAYSVSGFTRWQGDSIDMVWLKSRADPPHHTGDFYGARPADRPIHPIASIDPAPCTAQMGVPGPWHERLPHFRMDFTPSVGAEIQSEYFVPRDRAAAALVALRRVQDQFAGPLLVSELRTVAADEQWLSMNHRRDSLACHFTWQPDAEAVRRVLPIIEAALAPFGVRPHWGKVFTLPPAQVMSRYPRFAEFRALAGRFDPTGKFRNAFVADYLA